ncbi:MAG: hypothetical protein ACXVEF_31410 [Polyangiales bacterium]
MRFARTIVALALAGATIAMLAPENVRATRTVGHQGRALRLRRILAPELPAGPRLCSPDEIPTDRDPCIVASSKAAFQR